MVLAEALRSASPADVRDLADFILGEFEITERAAMGVTPAPATGASVASALGAWAYMKLNAQDQGD